MNSPLDHGRALLARARDDAFVVRRLMHDAAMPGWLDAIVARTIAWAEQRMNEENP